MSLPSFLQTDLERNLWLSRDRDREVISAMQRRQARNPLRDLLWRRPWRSRSRPFQGASVRHPVVSAQTFWSWLANAHDCADPAVGCSCSGGYRFPWLVDS